MKHLRIPNFFHEFERGVPPAINLDDYRLVIDGAVQQKIELSLQELCDRVPIVRCSRRFYCVNGWSLAADWEGFDIKLVLDLARPNIGADYLRAISIGGYDDTTPIRELVDGKALLVTRMNGELLAPERGFPIRLMVFDKYQFRGVKALARLEVVAEFTPGTWVRYGYSDATIQPFPHLAIDSGEEQMPDPELFSDRKQVFQT